MLVRLEELPRHAVGPETLTPPEDAMSSAPGWPTKQIEEALAAPLPGLRVELLPQIDSTNSELMRRARNGQMEPVLLVAEQQTAGRGRLGRHWFSGEATSVAHKVSNVGAIPSLTFSLGLPLSPRDWSGLSLAVGVCVVQSLHPDLRLKWPNDVWWHERKLAGILIETASFGELRYAVIGIGINIERRENSGLATPAAWLQELLPAVDASQALLRIAIPLVQTVKAFERHGFAPFQAGFTERDALSGLNVALSDGTVGVAQGVDGAGALRLHTAQGLQKITSAEVSVRPLLSPSLDGF